MGFQPDSIFATKVMLKSSPLSLLTYGALFFILILSLLIRAFEYCDIMDVDIDLNSFSNLWNSLWLNILTMSTSKI